MPFDEEYFASDEFQELLNSYETSEASGDTMFLDADDLVDIADYYNMQGSPEHALTAVRQGLELYPDHVLLNVFMARRALEEENVEQAEQYADNIGDKDAPDYHYLRAEILIAQNRIDEADRYLRDYGMTVEADEYGDFVKDVANLYVDYDVSDKAYEWMLRSTSDNSDDFKELMGRALFGVGKYKDSQRMFNELLDNHPFSKQYWTALATAQYMDEDYNGSITSSEYAIAIDPNDPDGLLTKANGLMKLGNYEQAAEYFHRYSQTCPDDAMGPLHEAACMVNLGKNAEAVPLLEKAVGLPNSNDVLPQIYQELAFAFNALGELDRALETIDKTKELECDHAEMLVIRGHLLLTHGLIDEAEDTFRKAMKESHADPHIILRIIISLYDNRYVKAAYMMLKKFMTDFIGDTFYAGYAYMALCCWDLNYNREFLDNLEKAVRLDPSETRIVLGFLFPEDLPVSEYYNFMTEHINDNKQA